MEMLHKKHYAAALQAAKKFVSKEDFRPVLNTVCHRADGSLVATDSHRLLLVRDVHGFKEEFLVNPKTFEFATGQYPDTSKIVPEPKEPNFVLTDTHIKMWIQAHKAMAAMKEEEDNRTVKLDMAIDPPLFSPNKAVKMELPRVWYKAPDIVQISYNALYMVDALQALQKLGAKEVKVSLYTELGPFTLESENALALVLPVRY